MIFHHFKTGNYKQFASCAEEHSEVVQTRLLMEFRDSVGQCLKVGYAAVWLAFMNTTDQH